MRFLPMNAGDTTDYPIRYVGYRLNVQVDGRGEGAAPSILGVGTDPTGDCPSGMTGATHETPRKVKSYAWRAPVCSFSVLRNA